VADFADIDRGLHLVEVRLLDSAGRTVAARRLRAQVEGRTAVQVLVGRDCLTVSCGAGETCARGTCVSEECNEELSPDACSSVECMADTDCDPLPVACATPTCELGTCLAAQVSAACGSDEYCDVARGCRPRGGGPMDGGMDGGMDADTSTSDAGWPTGPFGAPSEHDELGPGDDPTLTPDLLEIYFEISGRIFRARRADPTVRFERPTMVPELDIGLPATNPELSHDGLEISVSYRPMPMVGNTLRRSTRSTMEAPWSPPEEVAELVGDTTRAGFVTDATNTIGLFHEYAPSGGSSLWEILLVTRADTSAPWGMPAYASDINTDESDLSPFLRADGLMVLYETGVIGEDTAIVMKERSTTGDLFGAPTTLTELDQTSAEDGDPWLSPDGRTIFFYSNRTGSPAIYSAQR
jgi:hypothetical protein